LHNEHYTTKVHKIISDVDSRRVGNIAEWGREHLGYRGWIRDDVETLSSLKVTRIIAIE
jgi:hypothetical protein